MLAQKFILRVRGHPRAAHPSAVNLVPSSVPRTWLSACLLTGAQEKEQNE